MRFVFLCSVISLDCFVFQLVYMQFKIVFMCLYNSLLIDILYVFLNSAIWNEHLQRIVWLLQNTARRSVGLETV